MLIVSEKEFNSDDLVNKGLASYQLGKYEEALEYYNKALEIDPNFEEAWFRKGKALGVLLQTCLAIKELKIV